MYVRILLLAAVLISGCSLAPKVPDTLAENYSSYSYVPFDPLPVSVQPGKSCRAQEEQCLICKVKVTLRDLKNALPDQTVRIAVAEFNADGSLTYGPATVGLEGKSYQVIVDYMNTDTVPGSFLVRRKIVGQIPRRNFFGWKYEWVGYNSGQYVDVFQQLPAGVVSTYEVKPNLRGSDSSIFSNEDYRNESSSEDQLFKPINLPVYVGLGLRLTATIQVLKGTVKLAGLPAIAAEAQAGNVTGTLVVQTLGATGEKVSTNLPLPSELNQTTIQNSIISLASIKALLPDESLQLTPRVVGIYNPYGGGQSLVNGIISSLASNRLTWSQPCDPVKELKKRS